MADINDYLDGLNYTLNAEEKQLMDIFAECWEHCHNIKCENCEYRSTDKYCKMLICISYQYAKRLIDHGVKSVRHGYWIEDKYGSVFECSECGYSTDYRLTNYCPDCGALMDGYNNLDINCCEYCRVNDDFKCSVIHFDGGDNGTVDVQMPFDEMEIIYKNGEETVFHLDFEINYCPMCGRKLKTVGKKNDNDQR